MTETVKMDIYASISNIIATTFSRRFSLSKTINSSIFAVVSAGLSYACTSQYVRDVIAKSSVRNLGKYIGIGYYQSKKVFNRTQIDSYLSFMRSFSQYFDCSIDGVEDFPSYLYKMKRPFAFHDYTNNVSGMIQFSTENKIPCIVFTQCVLKDDTTMDQYIKQVSDVYETIQHDRIKADNEQQLKEKNKNTRTLMNVLPCNGQKITEVIYHNTSVNQLVLESIFMKTIFHKDIDALWSQIKTIHYNPQKLWDAGIAPRMNLLLHGPPGTGKSTFAYRIAMATERHIINVKLNDYSKDELLKLFRNPVIGDKKYYPRDVVYVLDEFDIDIERILIKSLCKTKQLEKIDSMVGKLFENIADNLIVKQPPKKVEVAKPPTETAEKTDAGQVEEKKPIDIVESSKELQEDIDKVNKYLDATTSIYGKLNTIGSDIIRIEDLLTIFQGAVPIEGCIIIAMTNKFDELSKKCPALFRPGRLSPVYFGHFDLNILNKVSNHYFGKGLTFFDPMDTELSIPPSQVMEIVSAAILNDIDKYGYFVKKLQQLLTIKIAPINEPEKFLCNHTNFSLFRYDEPCDELTICDKITTNDMNTIIYSIPNKVGRIGSMHTLYYHTTSQWKTIALCSKITKQSKQKCSFNATYSSLPSHCGTDNLLALYKTDINIDELLKNETIVEENKEEHLKLRKSTFTVYE